MAACTETNAYFETMAATAHDFFDQDGWEDIAEANYNKNKDRVFIIPEFKVSLKGAARDVTLNNLIQIIKSKYETKKKRIAW